MSKQITMTAYEFDELSDKAKEKAREWWREATASDNNYSDSVIEEAVEQGALMGIEIAANNRAWTSSDGKRKGVDMSPRIFWSGFWSQGDGACFEGTWRASGVKADKVADGWGEDPATTEIKRIAAEFDRIAKAYPNASFTVKHSGHYNHEHCTEFDCDPGNYEWTCEDNPETEGPVEVWERDFPEDALIEAAKDFMRWIYSQLEKEYEYQNSDEQVDEMLRANEYLFTESGSRSSVL